MSRRATLVSVSPSSSRGGKYTAEIATAWLRVVGDRGCSHLYFCPSSGEIECPQHSGFSVCCNHSDLHVSVY
jgi:hypothetical protein